MSTAILLLSILLLPVAMPAPVHKDPGQVALQEEMNLLAYGVMQFSEALHNLYHSTAQKLDRIKHRTSLYEQGLRLLHHQTQNARRGQEEIRGMVERLMVEDMRLRQDVQSREKGLQRLLGSHQRLAQHVTALQEVLDTVERQGLRDQELDLAALKSHPVVRLKAGDSNPAERDSGDHRDREPLAVVLEGHRGLRTDIHLGFPIGLNMPWQQECVIIRNQEATEKTSKAFPSLDKLN